MADDILPFFSDYISGTMLSTIDGGELSDYSSYSDMDLWGWDGPLVPVPGFGFLPPKMEHELEYMAQVREL